MKQSRFPRRGRPAKKTRTSKTRLVLERLEDRTLPSGVEWLLRLEGLSGTTVAEQMEEAQDRLHAAGVQDQDVLVVDHATLDGNIVIEAPPGIPQAVLTQELAVVPGQDVAALERSVDASRLERREGSRRPAVR